MKRLLRILGRTLLALIVLAVLLEVGRRIRARWFLPAVDLTVIRYGRICEFPEGPGEVSPADLLEQLRDLYDCGYRSVTPEQLRRHASRGEPLPERPVLLVLDVPSADLVMESEPGDSEEALRSLGAESVESILRGFGEDSKFTAVVGLPADGSIAEDPASRRAAPDGVPLLVWSEIQAAERRGVLSFAVRASDSASPETAGRAARDVFSRLASGPRILLSSAPAGSAPLRAAAEAAGADWAIGTGDRIARVGPRTDPFDVPSVAVVGGRHRFSVRVVQDSVDPASFGQLLVAHVEGAEMPLSLAVYDQARGLDPVLRADLPALSLSETSSIALPAGIRFPLSVFFYDPTGSVFYHKRDLTRREVEKSPYYRPPVGLPDEEVVFDPL